jgi:coenzyme F420 hydrogenase subunit delta
MNSEANSYLPDFCTKPVLILGCGNRLFGDDGFGPAVIDYLFAHYEIPGDVYAMDVGTAVRKLLFTLSLSEKRPRRILIIDAVDKVYGLVDERSPGEIFELSLDDVPAEKKDDFSLHQAPSSNLAKELRDVGVDIRVMVCQVARIPTIVEPGLSEVLRKAVPEMARLIAEDYFCTEACPVETYRAPSSSTSWLVKPD